MSTSLSPKPPDPPPINFQSANLPADNQTSQTIHMETEYTGHGPSSAPGSFKDKLKASTNHVYFDQWFTSLEKMPKFETYREATQRDEHIPFLTFSDTELQEFSSPWKQAVFIQTVGCIRTINSIATHLTGLWKLQGKITVTSLGHGFYVVSFLQQEDFMMVLAGGPWFLFNYYLAVQSWKPSFDPTQGTMDYMLLWIQLYDLPLELYHPKALYKIGQVLGRPIKMDIHTVTTNRTRYARICVEINIIKPLVSLIQVGSRIQKVQYELFGEFCAKCGMVGHTVSRCAKMAKRTQETSENPQPQVKEQQIKQPEWTQVVRKPFHRQKKTEQGKGKNINSKSPHSIAVYKAKGPLLSHGTRGDVGTANVIPTQHGRGKAQDTRQHTGVGESSTSGKNRPPYEMDQSHNKYQALQDLEMDQTNGTL